MANSTPSPDEWLPTFLDDDTTTGSGMPESVDTMSAITPMGSIRSAPMGSVTSPLFSPDAFELPSTVPSTKTPEGSISSPDPVPVVPTPSESIESPPMLPVAPLSPVEWESIVYSPMAPVASDEKKKMAAKIEDSVEEKTQTEISAKAMTPTTVSSESVSIGSSGFPTVQKAAPKPPVSSPVVMNFHGPVDINFEDDEYDMSALETQMLRLPLKQDSDTESESESDWSSEDAQDTERDEGQTMIRMSSRGVRTRRMAAKQTTDGYKTKREARPKRGETSRKGATRKRKIPSDHESDSESDYRKVSSGDKTRGTKDRRQINVKGGVRPKFTVLPDLTCSAETEECVIC